MVDCIGYRGDTKGIMIYERYLAIVWSEEQKCFTLYTRRVNQLWRKFIKGKAMKDQHTLIKGYRDLSQEEIDLMNKGKELAESCREYIEQLEKTESIDKRWLAIGRTDIQKGFMSVIRSIAKPETF